MIMVKPGSTLHSLNQWIRLTGRECLGDVQGNGD